MNSPQIFQQKKELRQRMESTRCVMPSTEVIEKSTRIQTSLKALPEYKQAGCIHSYVSWKNEVDTHTLIKEMLSGGKKVVVPLINQKEHSLTHCTIESFGDLRPGAFDILEPKPEEIRSIEISELDLIIIPGVAFDLRGHRLGFGGGYYDSFLSKSKAVKIALAYQFQIVGKVPTRVEDQKVDLIVTEEKVFKSNFEF